MHCGWIIGLKKLKMNKYSLYTFIKLITPPFVFNLITGNSLYPLLKSTINKILPNKYEANWKTIQNGELKGREVFVANNSPIDEMFENIHDDFMYKYISKDQVVFDIGGHIGSNAMFFAQIVGESGKVLSFEPNPFNVAAFEKNLERNPDLKVRIQICNLALSDKKGEEEFLFTDNVEGGTSSGSFIENADTIWPKKDYEEKAGFKKMQVKTDTLDNFIAEKNIRPDVLKIDVEGAEYLVLEGAQKTIAETRPLLLIEIHSIFNMFKVTEILSQNEYVSEIIKKESDGRCFLICRSKKN